MTAAAALGVCVQTRTPALLWGPPGAGKSAHVRALARATSQHLETVLAALREPSDFAGLPIVGPDGRVRLAAPAWAQRLVDARGGVLFLDEVSCAPPSVQAACLRLLEADETERWVGDLRLPPGLALVLAANPPSQAAGGWDLAAPAANRCCHLEWPAPTSEAWAQAQVTGTWPEPAVPALPEGWETSAAAQRARALLAAYHLARRPALSACPDDAAQAGRAWPSPRSWASAARLLAACASLGEDLAGELALLLVGGCVGEGAALEWATWARAQDLPDPEAVLAHPATWSPDAPRPDRTWATLCAVVGAVASKATPARWTAGWAVLERAAQHGAADVACACGRQLMSVRPQGAPIPASLAALAPLLRAAGLLEGGGR